MNTMIIILSILVRRSQGEYIDNESNVMVSTITSLDLITENPNESIIDENKRVPIESSTEHLFDKLNEDRINVSRSSNDLADVTSPSVYFDETSLSNRILSSINYFDSTTIDNDLLFRKEQWYNYNQTNKQESFPSSIVWRKVNDEQFNSSSYIIKSEGECVNRMCRVKLKYNGSRLNNIDGCLSFVLWTRGQPVGQLWIEEDEEQENFSQKIQLTNSSLRVEHSLRANIKNLSIDARILFRNSKIDSISLSNLNVNWNGSCPKYHSMTPIPNLSLYESTFEQYSSTSSNNDYYETSLLTTDNHFENTENDLFIRTSTIKFDVTLKDKKSFSFIDEKNIRWILIIIILFCLLIISLSFIYGWWSIKGHHKFIWYVRFNSPIQFITRRSISSSIKSENRTEKLSETLDDLFHIDYQQEYFDSFSTNTNRSRSSPFYAYF